MRDLNGVKRELGDGFSVARVLPHPHQRTVGPFVFFDYFGPVDFAPGKGIDVRPHPHIGLATVTYLFEGSQVHRDSLGNAQEIVPGDVNWMTAGRGIVHSERTGRMRARGVTACTASRAGWDCRTRMKRTPPISSMSQRRTSPLPKSTA